VFKVEDILKERYQLKERLGRTATGHQTWLAVDLESSEQVILKLLAFSPQMSWEELKLFEREAEVLASLTYPNIPCYRDYFDLAKNIGDEFPWFVLVQDYIPGLSLQEYLEKGRRFEEAKIREITQQILEILIYLHELSPPVLHRDIKPSNLILANDKKIYLVDFGAVQAQAAVTGVTFTVVGTSGYAPLEQFWGRAVPASDLYALGATLIHLLTGVHPVDLPHQDYRIQFRDRVSIVSDLIVWIETATDLAVDKRFKSAREALEALQTRKIQSTSHHQAISYRKVAKPSKTHICLTEFSDRIEIYIPPGGLNRIGEGLSRIGCFGSLLSSGFFLFLLGQFSVASSVISTLELLIYLPFFVFTLGFLLSPIAGFLFADSRITLDKNKFRMKHQLFGANFFANAECDNAEIYGVFVDNKGGNYRVSIRSNQGVYFLGGVMNEHESTWLAQEIRSWLNLR
jgi:serine/threonine protein kinase